MRKLGFALLSIGVLVSIHLSNTVLASSGETNKLCNPTYTSNIVELTDDNIYDFLDGKLQAGPVESLVMINGTFASKVTVIIKNDSFYVPIRIIAESFGAKVSWFADKKEVVVKNADTEISMNIDNPKIKMNGEEKALGFLTPFSETINTPPLLINNTTYVPISFISDYLNVEITGDSRYSSEGEYIYDGIAPNPIFSFENTGVSKQVDEKSVQILTRLKTKLREGLESSKISNTGRYKADIDKTKYIGSLGRYALFDGLYPILVDVYSNDIYYYQHSDTHSSLQKANATMPEFFQNSRVVE